MINLLGFKKRRCVLLVGVAAAILFIGIAASAFYVTEIVPPVQFPSGNVVTIANGQSLSQIARGLTEEHLIRSSFWFVNAVLMIGRKHEVVAGNYYFPQPENVFTVAWRLTHGDYKTNQIKTTIPDDSSVNEIAFILKNNYPSFDTVHFLTIANSQEGYLFPDTYYFGPAPTPEDVVATMRANFEQKISLATTAAAITAFGKPLSEVITMASIVEREASTMHDRQIVAGILWKRLALGIPLSVDSTLYYLTGRTSSQLTTADLANKSPYNTYIHKGLPPTPIGNPSLDAIMATLTPIQTNYLYFLSDKTGTMHYAATLAGQHANQVKYLH